MMNASLCRPTVILSATLLAAALFPGATSLRAADAKPKYSTEEIMKALNKGQENIGKRATRGQASKDDLAKLVEYYDALPANKPPKGDPSSWTAKTTALARAAHALHDGKPGSLEAFKEASNCKACHSLHKPQDKK